MGEKWLRKTGFDVLANIGKIETGSQKTDELFKRPFMRVQTQQIHVQYNATEVTETICTRLDAFGRVFRAVLDGVDGGVLVVEKRSNGEEEMWSANGSEKRGSKWNFPMMN